MAGRWEPLADLAEARRLIFRAINRLDRHPDTWRGGQPWRARELLASAYVEVDAMLKDRGVEG